MMAVDILGPLQRVKLACNSYLLGAGDCFTRWIEAYPIPNMEASIVARKLINEFSVILACWNSFTQIKVNSLNPSY